MSTICRRGALIVLEGCDRSGKTTQCKKLVEALRLLGKKVEYINFPARNTPCGALIDSYLRKKQDFSDEGIHLLFTLNRWEAKNNMERLLNDGITLIVDRYSYSGVAFSAAKGLDYEWCKAPEAGLLKPDLVILLTLSTEAMARRGGFGDERYDIPEFQKKVLNVYQRLKDENLWKIVDADKEQDKLSDELKEISLETIEKSKDKEIKCLW